jgi:hypothetical protein
MRNPHHSRSIRLRLVRTVFMVLVCATALASTTIGGDASQYKIVFWYYVSVIPTAWSNIRPVCGFSCNDRNSGADLGLKACQVLVGKSSMVQAQKMVMATSESPCGAELYAQTCTVPAAPKEKKLLKGVGDDYFCSN